MITRNDHHSSAKAFIAYLIFMIAAIVFVIFNQNVEMLFAENKINQFIFLTFVGMGLLIALLYLVNQPHSKPKKRKR